LPSDVQGRFTAELVTPGSIATSRDAALATAAAAEPYLSRIAIAQAFPTVLTDPTTLRGKQPILNRYLWLVRYTGFAIGVVPPNVANGDAPSADYLRVAYVLIDGDTGEWISTRLDSD
jgi:hypothetical protein